MQSGTALIAKWRKNHNQTKVWANPYLESNNRFVQLAFGGNENKNILIDYKTVCLRSQLGLIGGFTMRLQIELYSSTSIRSTVAIPLE